MANRTIELTLKANTQGMINGVKTAQRSVANAGRDIDNFRRQNEQAWNTVGTTLTAAGTAVTAGVGMAVKAAIDWESAWAGVQKTNEGTEQQMTSLEEDLRNLATTLPATHAEIAAVAEAAGQLGVGVDDVSEFTETMINLGETTNLSANEAATQLARFSNITGTAFSDVDKLGSTVVELGNNFATTESEILAMSERIAAAGTQAGLTDGEIMGLATAMSSVGIEAQAGGTAMTQTFNEIDGAVREGGESLEGWAELAGVSAEEFSSAWQEDPATAITMMVEGLGRVADSGGDVNGTLEDLGIQGIRQADTLRRLAGASDLVGESLEVGNAAFEENSALAEEAALRYETVESKISVAWNNIKDAAITAGEVILPAVGSVADAVGGIADAFADLPPAVSGSLTILGGVAGVAAVAAGGLMLLAPRALETYHAFRQLGRNAPRVATGIGRVGRVAGIALPALAALQIANTIFDPKRTSGSADQFAAAIKGVAEGTDGAAGRLAELSSQTVIWGEGIDDIGEAFDVVNWGGFMTGVSHVASILPGAAEATGIAADMIKEFDAGVASLVEQGGLEAAAEGFRHLAEQEEMWGKSSEEIMDQLPQLKTALQDAGISTEEFHEAMTWAAQGIDDADLAAEMGVTTFDDLRDRMSASEQAAFDAAAGASELEGELEEVGIAADGTVESLGEYLDMLFQTGLKTMDANEAQRQYRESLNGVTDAVTQITESGGEMGAILNKNGDDFSYTTEAGLLAGRAFEDVARAGFDSATAMAEAGESQDDIQAKLTGTYEDLITAAGKFGITGEAAHELARETMGIPDGVDIETWMSEQAKATAEETTAAAFQVPDDVNIDSFMSDSAYRTSILTTAGIDDVPNGKDIESWMSDDAFIEALDTRAAVLDIPPEDVINSFMSSAARDEADSTTAEVLGIPEGASISSWMSSDARAEAQSTNDWLNIIDGRRTSSSHTHTTWNVTRAASSNQQAFVGGDPRGATGGRVGRDFGFPRLANGGRLPYTGLGTDQILGLSSGGKPTALVDDGEWVIRERSADKYNSVLDRINADHPSVQHLAGYADGGRAAGGAVQARQMAAAMAGAGGGGGAQDITGAVLTAVQNTPIHTTLNIDGKTLIQAVNKADQQYVKRR